MIMIDSNMWIYYFDESLEEHKYVKEPMREVILEKRILANTIVIDEIDNFGVIDPVPEKNDPVNGGGA